MRFFLGLLFLVLSLPTLWLSQSQHRADTFLSAERVAMDQQVNGEVVVEGSPALTQSVACPLDESQACVYSRVQQETFQRSEFVECGQVLQRQGVMLLRQVEDSCVEQTRRCQSCYAYQEDKWMTDSDVSQYAEIQLGAYTIKPARNTIFLGTEIVHDPALQVNVNVTNNLAPQPVLGDKRTTIEYLPQRDQIVVLGNALDGYIGGESGELFVVSNQSYGQTAASLSSMDTSSRWGLMIGSLFLMVLGFVLFVSQFAAPVAGLFRMLPIVGGPITHGAQALIYVVVAIAAALIWTVCFGLVVLLKNIVVVGLVVLAVLLAIVVWQKHGQTLLKKK